MYNSPRLHFGKGTVSDEERSCMCVLEPTRHFYGLGTASMDSRSIMISVCVPNGN